MNRRDAQNLLRWVHENPAFTIQGAAAAFSHVAPTEPRTPRIHVGGAYYPKPGWQIIVLDVFRHARGWSVEGMHRFSGSTVVRTDVIGYLEFCRLVGVEP